METGWTTGWALGTQQTSWGQSSVPVHYFKHFCFIRLHDDKNNVVKTYALVATQPFVLANRELCQTNFKSKRLFLFF